MTHRNETLSEQIERLVHAHIEATRREASEAVTRAFASALAAPRACAALRPTRTVGRRRGAAALSALGERLYEAVRAQPGETMAVLAPELHCSPRELHRPMAALTQAGRVRSVGQRPQTRYYDGGSVGELIRPPLNHQANAAVRIPCDVDSQTAGMWTREASPERSDVSRLVVVVSGLRFSPRRSCEIELVRVVDEAVSRASRTHLR